MSYRWFTNYTGLRWTPAKGYNTAFAEQVRLIREWFRLKKTTEQGIELSTGSWRKYILQEKTVFVKVDRFDWRRYEGYGSDITLQFQLVVRMAQEKPRGILAIIFNDNRQATIAEFFRNTLVIKFPSNYPQSPPQFKIDDPDYYSSSSSHDHHMFSGGWFCILASPDDWSSSRDTVISGLNAALDWIVWHHQKFGW